MEHLQTLSCTVLVAKLTLRRDHRRLTGPCTVARHRHTLCLTRTSQSPHSLIVQRTPLTHARFARSYGGRRGRLARRARRPVSEKKIGLVVKAIGHEAFYERTDAQHDSFAGQIYTSNQPEGRHDPGPSRSRVPRLSEPRGCARTRATAVRHEARGIAERDTVPHVCVTPADRASVTGLFHATMSDQLVQQHAALELTYVLCMSHLPYSLAKLTRTT